MSTVSPLYLWFPLQSQPRGSKTFEKCKCFLNMCRLSFGHYFLNNLVLLLFKNICIALDVTNNLEIM